MTVWLIVERLDNWLIDKAEGFKRFGLPERSKGRAQEVMAGDLLVFYVSSGISSFSDIREAAGNGTETLQFGGDYDTAYPIALRTKAHLILEREKWLPMREIASELSVFAGKDWRQMMRTTLRKLSEPDGVRLVEAIKARA